MTVTVIDTSAFMKFFLHEDGWEDVLPHLATASSPETVDLDLTRSQLTSFLKIYPRCGLIEKERVPQTVRIHGTPVYPGTSHPDLPPGLWLKRYQSRFRRILLSTMHCSRAQARTDRATLVTADRQLARCAEKCGVVAILVEGTLLRFRDNVCIRFPDCF